MNNDGKLAAELKAAAEALAADYNKRAGLTHERMMLRGDGLVPALVGAALETANSLAAHVASPPENLRTRARLTEQYTHRAGTYTWLIQQVKISAQTYTPPATIAQALNGLCLEATRLADHATALGRVQYEPGDEASEYASILAAELRGELTGVRRALAILLGLPRGEAADHGEAEAYITAWQAARIPDDPWHALAVMLSLELLNFEGPHARPLVLTVPAEQFVPSNPDEAARLGHHGAIVLPTEMAARLAASPTGRVPDEAIDAIPDADRTEDGLDLFIGSHRWTGTEWRLAPGALGKSEDR